MATLGSSRHARSYKGKVSRDHFLRCRLFGVVMHSGIFLFESDDFHRLKGFRSGRNFHIRSFHSFLYSPLLATSGFGFLIYKRYVIILTNTLPLSREAAFLHFSSADSSTYETNLDIRVCSTNLLKEKSPLDWRNLSSERSWV